MSMKGKWGYSTNEEWYTGSFDTREDAIAEGREYGSSRFWVGQFVDPPTPESYIDAEDIIEKVLCQDEYCLECADGCLSCTREQQDELTTAIRKTFGEWLDKHDLRPTFGLVENAEEINTDEAEEGKR